MFKLIGLERLKCSTCIISEQADEPESSFTVLLAAPLRSAHFDFSLPVNMQAAIGGSKGSFISWSPSITATGPSQADISAGNVLSH